MAVSHRRQRIVDVLLERLRASGFRKVVDGDPDESWVDEQPGTVWYAEQEEVVDTDQVTGHRFYVIEVLVQALFNYQKGREMEAGREALAHIQDAFEVVEGAQHPTSGEFVRFWTEEDGNVIGTTTREGVGAVVARYRVRYHREVV